VQDMNRRLASLFARGVVRHADVQAGLAMAQAEFLKDETRRVELPQGYGFASSLMPGAEVFAGFANGERDAGIALAFDDRRYRPLDLKSGEVILYGVHARQAPNWHWIKFTDQPKPGTIKIRASRIELRAGQFYRLLDSDPAIGERAGIFDPTQELPLAP
jgi:hypothetical protein